MEQSWRWAPLGPDRQELIVGEEQWPFPVPLAKSGDQWVFDSEAGKQEVLARRIGRNELGVIDLSRCTWTAEGICGAMPHDGKPARPVRTAPAQYSRPPGWALLENQSRREAQPVWAIWLLKRRTRATQRIRRRFAVLGLPVSDPDGTRRIRAGRQEKLRREWRHDGRLCARGVSCQVRIKWRNDFHRQSGRSCVPEGPGQGHADSGRPITEYNPDG